MKLLYFLILLFIVNVWTVDVLLKYKEEVIITNKLIKQAFKRNGVEDNKSVRERPGITDYCTGEDSAQQSNGLEVVIKAIVWKEKFSTGEMNRMFAIPVAVTSSPLKRINEYKKHETTMQKEIKDELDLSTPEVTKEDLKNLTWEQLRIKRRRLIRKALRSILSQALDNDKIKVTPNTTRHKRSKLSGTSGKDKTVLLDKKDGDCYRSTWPLEIMCRFIALYSSSLYETDYLLDLTFEKNTCYITNYHSVPESFSYKKFNGIWHQVGMDPDVPLQPLEEQLDYGPRVVRPKKIT
ncbi:uncharacterized protein LOC126835137 [Adelges cooleyi]|uniref:uncharacterized protein LOC126835137 n=1 Tax=Adelges cooleyi TaxID=133065 RepID=UPI002180189C|nr:uncharacterized protein LOC126835137 [Adelges cooleyi]